MQKTSALSSQQGIAAQETPQTNQRSQKYSKPHMIIPDEDMAWALEQRPPVYKLWGECWRSDPYGSRWMPLRTSLGKENLKKAKRPLIDSGLFMFENRLTVVDGKRSYEWWIKNLHGCRSSYWKLKGFDFEDEIDSTEVDNQDTEVGTQVTTHSQGGVSSPNMGSNNNEMGVNSTELGVLNTEVGTDNTTEPYLSSLAERVSRSLINISVTLHKHFSNSLKIGEREEFLNFCLQKIKAIQSSIFEVRSDDGWIAKHYEQYWNEFCSKHRPEAVQATTANKWRNHPQCAEWLAEIERTGNPAMFAGSDKEKQAFVKWCWETKQFSWLKEEGE